MSLNETIADIETIHTNNVRLVDEAKTKLLVKDLIKETGNVTTTITTKQIDSVLTILGRKYKTRPSKAQMRYIIEKYFNDMEFNSVFSRYVIKRAGRSDSGVLVCTVVLKPSKFSCPKKCGYCPTETDIDGNPTQPKSYLSSEPAMLRALQYNFDVRGQIWDRIRAYINTGNIVSDKEGKITAKKLEIILSGGTWESYPYDYRNQVMAEIYWAANTFNSDRTIMSVEEEITLNETSEYRVIGLTIETRPDFVTNTAIRDYRRWGVTRVQLGVQHYDDSILDYILRECPTETTIKTIAKLKQCGFKIVCHLMPDLPGSSPEKDIWMFDQALQNPDLQFDDVKIYPTAVCKSHDPKYIVTSLINTWYEEGKYVPYAEQDLSQLVRVLKYYKTRVQKWIRIQRLVRDIPAHSILVGYESVSNLRQVIQEQMKKEGTRCMCIRCMEIGGEQHKLVSNKLVVTEYKASGGTEYFISMESHKVYSYSDTKYWINLLKYLWFMIKAVFTFIFYDKILFWSGDDSTYEALIGFCRLRIDPNPGGDIIKELNNCALIREVHVYGRSLGVGSDGKSTQHKGVGQTLVRTAEIIAAQHGYTKTAVIAGVGTREYYKNKCGYHLGNTYMLKNISKIRISYEKNIIISFLVILFSFVMFNVIN